MGRDISSRSCTLLRETQISIECEIENFWDLPMQEDCYLNSGSFPLAGAEWYILIYPNGKKRDQSVGWISLFLYKRTSPSDVRVFYTLGIKKADGSVLESIEGTYLFEKVSLNGWGSSAFFQRSELLESTDVLTPNGSLVIFCCLRQTDIAFVGVNVASQASFNDGDETLSDNFKDLYLTGCEADVSISVKGKQFKAHKSVLVARSPVFHSMFQQDMVEKNDNAVNITDCEPEFFEDFLLFLYSGKLDIVTSENARELYSTADKYDVKTLKTECCKCLTREISVDSVCDILSMATLYSEKKLFNTAKEFFINNAETIVTTAKWLSFMSDHLTLANELFVAKITKK